MLKANANRHDVVLGEIKYQLLYNGELDGCVVNARSGELVILVRYAEEMHQESDNHHTWIL